MTENAGAFDCEGCGYRSIWWLGRHAPPAHRFCATCLHLVEYMPPDELMEVRRRCEPGGWESERQRRLMPAWLHDPC